MASLIRKHDRPAGMPGIARLASLSLAQDGNVHRGWVGAPGQAMGVPTYDELD